MARPLRLPAYPKKAATYRGINYSGMEFNTSTLPGTAGQDFFLATTADHQYATNKGFNIVRLALAWERVQPTKGGALSETYMGYVDTFITNAATYGWKVLLELHNYGGRKVAGTDQVINDGVLTYADFNDVWTRIASRYSDNDTVWGYDLMNEPHDMPVSTSSSTYNSTATWTIAAQGAINAIRAVDMEHYIVVETDNFSGFQNFFSDGAGHGATPTPWWTDSASKLYYSVHCYFDSNNSGAYSGANESFAGSGRDIRYAGDTIKLVLDWGVANNIKFVIGEYGVKNEDDGWLVMMNDFLNVIDSYPTAITFAWAFGPAYTSATTFSPTNNYTTDRNQMRVAEQHRGTASPVVTPSSFVFGTAIDTAASGFTSQAHSLSIPTILSELSDPYPTNVWWTNLFLGSNRVCPDPYQVKPVTQGLYVCYPTQTVTATATTTAFLQNMAIEASETIASRKIQPYSAEEMYNIFGVPYRWEVDSTHKMIAYLVQGMAYTTMEFTDLTPKITTQHAILNVNGTTVFPADITDTKFKIVLNNGQTWIIYASSSITLNVQNSSGWRLLADASFTGTIQLAYLKDSSYETTLDTYKNTYARGGSVSELVDGTTETKTFTWNKQGATSLLHFAYPHHMDILRSPTTTTLSYLTIKGNMTGIVGDSWTIDETLTSRTWDVPRDIPSDKLSAITSALAAETVTAPSSFAGDSGGSTYSFGKVINQRGRLATIAHMLGDTSKRDTIITNMKTALNPWLDGTSANVMKYDSTWKALTSTNGLASSSNQYGNGWQNDSHFHYGYWIRAAAVIARFDSTWKTSYAAKVSEMVRAIMNPSRSDTRFIRFRHFDYFAGHSWAAGLYDFGDAKNQESTCEAVSAWYGCYLWGVAIGDDNIKNHARILLAAEMRSAKKYWQLTDGEIVGILWSSKKDRGTFFGDLWEYIYGIQIGYDVSPITEELLDPTWAADAYNVLSTHIATRTFAARSTVNAGGSGYTNGTHNNVTVSTGGATMNIEVAGGAVTTIYGLVNRGTGYTNNQIVTINAPGGGTGAQAKMILEAEQGWLNSVYALQAMSDKESAWTNITNQTAFDEGNSKTNLLYIAATAPA